MALFGRKTEGGLLDVIRCDEPEYLMWKWSPNGSPSNRENSIRWGSSLRVKDGEVAVFVYKQPDGPLQDYIEGPFDSILKTANLPVISNIIGMAYAGQSPFQAEVYFINLAGNIRIPFGIPYFDVADPRFLDFPLRVAARGSILFNIKDYKGFIKRHRLINFDLNQFKATIKDAVSKYVKAIIGNIPSDFGIPTLQLERKLLEINDLVEPRIKRAFEEDFGVYLQRFDLETIEIEKDTDQYREHRRVTADLLTETMVSKTAVDAEHYAESMRIQRDESQRFQSLQTQTQHLAAHQINVQGAVLMTAADNLGQMSAMNLGGGGDGGGGGGLNPVGLMTGMAVGGALGGQMAGMMNNAGQAMQQPLSTPPPIPPTAYHVALGGQSAGPFVWAQLQDLVNSGQLSKSTKVWKQGMANWELASSVAELEPLFASMPPPL